MRPKRNQDGHSQERTQVIRLTNKPIDAPAKVSAMREYGHSYHRRYHAGNDDSAL
jgi:hypothetical protein